jgi:thiosulfate dehydrogenase [quinone] large subunit
MNDELGGSMTRTATAIRGPGWSRFQTFALVALRILIGWHFLYEGLAKLTNPYWTSAGYLAEAKGWFSGMFLDIASNPSALTAVDYLNIWGLILIGLGLMLGAFTQIATIAGIVLLALYYLAAPPLVGLTYAMPTEGSYLIVNKVLIELAALVVLLAFPTGQVVGIDRLIARKRRPDSLAKAHA